MDRRMDNTITKQNMTVKERQAVVAQDQSDEVNMYKYDDQSDDRKPKKKLSH